MGSLQTWRDATWRDWAAAQVNLGSHDLKYVLNHHAPENKSQCTHGAVCPAQEVVLPWCSNGLDKGRWEHAKSSACPPEWCTTSCRYRDFTAQDALACLRPRRWIHFMGDSHARNLFDGLANVIHCAHSQPNLYSSAAGGKATHNATQGRYANVQSCMSDYTNVSYLFRGKMMRQRTPRHGYTEEDDVHNDFLRECALTGRWPDVLIYSVGVHEAINWDKTVKPHANLTEGNLSLRELAADTNNFLHMLRKELKFKGTLVWWKPVALDRILFPWRDVQDWYIAASHLMHQRFIHEADRLSPPTLFADFQQTTAKHVRSYGGGHFPHLVYFHNNVLLNTMCPSTRMNQLGAATAVNHASERTIDATKLGYRCATFNHEEAKCGQATVNRLPCKFKDGQCRTSS